jgi:Tfp pilus assembly protein PilV
MRIKHLKSKRIDAFTLIEVMVACGIFFMAMFAILGVLSQCVRAVGSLQKDAPTAASVAAQAMANEKWEEGSDSGDFGAFYPDYTWDTITNYLPEITAGQDAAQPPVFELQIFVKHKGELSSALRIIHYSPGSPSKSGHRL